MRMLSLRRQNWMFLLPAALLWLTLGGSAAAQSHPPVSSAESECVIRTTQDSLQNDPQVRQNFNQMLSQTRAESCKSGEQAAAQHLSMMMQSLFASMYDTVIRKCFLLGLQQQDAQALWNDRQGMIVETLPYIMQHAFYKAIPRPLCP